MKLILSLCILIPLIFGPGCKTSARHSSNLTKPTVVEAGCGQCLMNLKEKKGCDLAVRFEGKSYFVDGFKMGQFGDSDAPNGMCNRMHKAKVTGEVVNGRFAAKSFEPISDKK